MRRVAPTQATSSSDDAGSDTRWFAILAAHDCSRSPPLLTSSSHADTDTFAALTAVVAYPQEVRVYSQDEAGMIGAEAPMALCLPVRRPSSRYLDGSDRACVGFPRRTRARAGTHAVGQRGRVGPLPLERHRYCHDGARPDSRGRDAVDRELVRLRRSVLDLDHDRAVLQNQ